MSLQEHFNKLSSNGEPKLEVSGRTFVVTFANKNEVEFPIDLNTLVKFLFFLRDKREACHAEWASIDSRKARFTEYEEKSYRAIYAVAKSEPGLSPIVAAGASQTLPLTRAIAKFIAYFGKLEYKGIDISTFFDAESVQAALSNIPSDFDELESAIHGRVPSTGEGNGVAADIQGEFEDWMRKTGQLSERTIKSYSVSSINLADKLLIKQDPLWEGLYSLRDPKKVEHAITRIDDDAEWVERNLNGNGMYSAGVGKYRAFLSGRSPELTVTGNVSSEKGIPLPKPFLILAGISGTGKTRYVRQQASLDPESPDNFLLIPVRPDWHEPSELLGYVSRIGPARFVSTPLLAFLSKAWRNAYQSVESGTFRLRELSSVSTFWVCLDEMNLAPVEQYFADFLSVLETRELSETSYRCEPILDIPKLGLTDEALLQLREDLGFIAGDPLWAHFTERGIPLPPNVVIAGTVNMDETTHGFSRKVIDRAFTLDFGAFFPNDFGAYFGSSSSPVRLTFPQFSRVTRRDLEMLTVDSDGERSIKFLGRINSILADTPFCLAFRALNELLVAVRSFTPSDDASLAAVWDDFLMSKVLPRIEGDTEKLDSTGSGNSLLSQLRVVVNEQLTPMLQKPDGKSAGTRPDLLRQAASPIEIHLRSLAAIDRMQKRLDRHNFTSFWP